MVIIFLVFDLTFQVRIIKELNQAYLKMWRIMEVLKFLLKYWDSL